jgi:hypothetical protein
MAWYGTTNAGEGMAAHLLWSRLHLMHASGEVSHSGQMTTCSAPMRRPAFRCLVGATRACQLDPIRPCTSSTSTSARVCCRTWPAGMSIAPWSSSVASQRRAKLPSVDWLTMTCARSHTAPRGASSGLWTTAHHIAVNVPPTSSARIIGHTPKRGAAFVGAARGERRAPDGRRRAGSVPRVQPSVPGRARRPGGSAAARSVATLARLASPWSPFVHPRRRRHNDRRRGYHAQRPRVKHLGGTVARTGAASP